MRCSHLLQTCAEWGGEPPRLQATPGCSRSSRCRCLQASEGRAQREPARPLRALSRGSVPSSHCIGRESLEAHFHFKKLQEKHSPVSPVLLAPPACSELEGASELLSDPPGARAPPAPAHPGAEVGIGSTTHRAELRCPRLRPLSLPLLRPVPLRLAQAGGKIPGTKWLVLELGAQPALAAPRQSGPGLAFHPGAANVKQMYQ